MQYLRIHVHYRPNHAPNTESAVDSHGVCLVQCCSVLCAVPTQRYSRHEKRCWRSCMHRSTITRLPSGASISRSSSFRSGAFRCGVGTAHGCTRRVGGTSAHSHSATACRVRRSLAHSGAYAVAWLGSEYLPQALRHASAPVFAIPPSAKALAPWLMRLVRPRC